MMKRLLVGSAAAAVVFSGVYGLAAGLNVGSDTLGAGNVAVAACQQGTLTPTYETEYSASNPVGYKVTDVIVTGLTSACHNMAFKVDLIASDNSTSLAQIEGASTGTGSSFTADFTSKNVAAANVFGVHVLVTGPLP